jgi:hypothetical protein
MTTRVAQKGLQLVSTTRQRTLALTEILSQTELDRSPAPGKWSVGEILDHLIKSDGVYYEVIRELFQLRQAGKEAYIRYGFKDINASVLGIPKSSIGFFEIPFGMFNLFVPRSIRTFLMTSRWFPTEAPDVARPRPGRSGDRLRRALNNAPDELETLFESQPGLKYDDFKFYHPLFGENNLYQLLQILTFHESIHHKQIQETILKIQ